MADGPNRQGGHGNDPLGTLTQIRLHQPDALGELTQMGLEQPEALGELNQIRLHHPEAPGGILTPQIRLHQPTNGPHRNRPGRVPELCQWSQLRKGGNEPRLKLPQNGGPKACKSLNPKVMPVSGIIGQCTK